MNTLLFLVFRKMDMMPMSMFNCAWAATEDGR